jgi:hypothetical protein
MKAIRLVAVVAMLALSACVPPGGKTNWGSGLNGFPVDEGCLAYHGSDPLYKGNKALAYATNCSASTTM